MVLIFFPFYSPTNILINPFLHIFLPLLHETISSISHQFEHILRQHTILQPIIHLINFDFTTIFLFLFFQSLYHLFCLSTLLLFHVFLLLLFQDYGILFVEISDFVRMLDHCGVKKSFGITISMDFKFGFNIIFIFLCGRGYCLLEAILCLFAILIFIRSSSTAASIVEDELPGLEQLLEAEEQHLVFFQQVSGRVVVWAVKPGVTVRLLQPFLIIILQIYYKQWCNQLPF